MRHNRINWYYLSLLLYFSCSSGISQVKNLPFPARFVQKSGNCIVRYTDDTIESIETLSNGIFCSLTEENAYRILPNSRMEFNEKTAKLLNGIAVFGNQLVLQNVSINHKFFFDNRWGNTQFFCLEVTLPDENLSGYCQFDFQTNYGLMPLQADLHYLRKTDSKAYYGFFVPYNVYWQIQDLKIYARIIRSNDEYADIKILQPVKKVDWKIQKLYFQSSKKQKKTTKPDQQKQKPKTYEEEYQERVEIWKKEYPLPFFKSGFCQPLINMHAITSEFGTMRDWIVNKKVTMSKVIHNGLDIAAVTGTPVYSSADGIVRYAQYGLMVGNMIIVDHGWGLFTEYLHLSVIHVKPGDIVHRGDCIGKVGSTGSSTGAHLHWGARIFTMCVDPRSILNLDNVFSAFDLK